MEKIKCPEKIIHEKVLESIGVKKTLLSGENNFYIRELEQTFSQVRRQKEFQHSTNPADNVLLRTKGLRRKYIFF